MISCIKHSSYLSLYLSVQKDRLESGTEQELLIFPLTCAVLLLVVDSNLTVEYQLFVPWVVRHTKVPLFQNESSYASSPPEILSAHLESSIVIPHEMAMSAAASNPDKFSPFQIHSTSYKTVNEHSIGVDVLVPKGLKPGSQKHPLMVRFHGGFLVSNLSSSLTLSYPNAKNFS